MDVMERAIALADLVASSSKALNGRYRFALTDSVVTVSDGDDWSRKTVTLADGESRIESSIAIVQAMKLGWYIRIEDAS